MDRVKALIGVTRIMNTSFDVNVSEIESQISSGNLSRWIDSWRLALMKDIMLVLEELTNE